MVKSKAGVQGPGPIVSGGEAERGAILMLRFLPACEDPTIHIQGLPLFFPLQNYYFISVYGCFPCKCVCVPACLPGARGSQKTASDSLKLK